MAGNNQYNSTANTSWTAPQNGQFTVELWGGGGGAGHYGRTTSPHGAGGGGGGAYVRSIVTCANGTAYTIGVGGGGANAANNGNGTAGGNTHFNNNEVRATGGRGGNNNGVGGVAGNAANSIYNGAGYNGGNGGANSALIGGGGGAGGGNTAKGNNGAANAGGAAGGGGGAGGNGGANNSAGVTGSIPGGGGGASGGNGGTTFKQSGSGNNGSVKISWNDPLAGSHTDGVASTGAILKGKGSLVGVVSAPVSEPALSSNVAACWEMDESSGTVYDNKGSLNGTPTNTPTQHISAKLGYGINFVKTSGQWVDCGTSHASVNPGTGDFSISAWFRLTDLSSSYCGICGSWAGGSIYWYLMVNSSDGSVNGVINFGSGSTYGDNNRFAVFYPSPSLTAGTWYHIMMVVDRDNEFRVYINNDPGTQTPDAISGASSINMTNTNSFALGRIGNDPGGNSHNINGDLDQVIFYNKALTSDDRTYVYNSGNGRAWPWGTALVTGTLGTAFSPALRGSTTGTGSNAGIIHGHGKLYGSTTGTGSNAGFFAKTRISGSTTGIGSNAGIIKGKGKLYGATTGTGSNAGILPGKGKLFASTGHIGSASDDFQAYAVGNLENANWFNLRSVKVRVADFSGDRRVIGTGASGIQLAVHTGAFGNDHSSQLTVDTVISGSPTMGVGVRYHIETLECGYAYIIFSTDRVLARYDNRTETQIATAGSGASAGDVIKIEIQGSTIRCYLNGNLDTALTGGTGIFTDATYAYGKPAIYITHQDVAGDLWEGVDIYTQITGNLGVHAATGSLAGITTGTGSNAGVLRAKGKLYGVTTGTGSNAGFFAKTRISGSTTGTASNAGFFAKTRITGSTTGTGSNAGILPAKGKLYGSTTGVATVSGTIHEKSSNALRGSTTGVGSNAGVLGGRGALLSYSLSTEKIINGTFDSATGWTISGAGLTVESGVARFANSSAGIYQNIDSFNMWYRYSVEIRNYGGGYLGISDWAVKDYVYLNSNGVFTGKFQYIGYGSFVLVGSQPLTADVDNFSIKEMSNFCTGVATVSGTIKGRYSIVGSTTGVGSNAGVIHGHGKLYGSTTGTGSNAGFFAKTRILGSATGIASNAAIIHGHGVLAAITTGVATVSGYLREKGDNALMGIINGIASNAGVIHGHGKLYGAVNGIATIVGKLVSLRGSTTGVGSNAGIIHAHGKLYGSTTGGLNNNQGIIHAHGKLYGGTTGTATDAGILVAKGKLYGSSTGVGSDAGIFHGHGKLYGSLNGVGSDGGRLGGRADCNGIILTYSQVSGNCTDKPIPGRVKGVVSGSSSILAILQSHYVIQGELIDGLSLMKLLLDENSTIKISINELSLIKLLLDENSTIKNILDEDSIITNLIDEPSLIL
jgi:hypothetical protein